MSHNRIAWLAAAAAAVTLSLSGCAGSDTPAAGSSNSAASSGAPAAADCTGKQGNRTPTKLTLALVPSGDAKKLVETVKPLTEASQQRLWSPRTTRPRSRRSGPIRPISVSCRRCR